MQMPANVVKYFEDNCQYLSYLAYRWKDEGQFEDFKTYIKAMCDRTPPSLKFIELKKRPFQVIVSDGTRDYFMKIKGNQIVTGFQLL